MKSTRILCTLILVALLGGYGFLLAQNNRETLPIDDQEIAQSYELGVIWLLNHRAEILQEPNIALWWMLGESAQISGDDRVQELFDEFLVNLDRQAPHSIWQAYFHPRRFRNARFTAQELVSLQEYQRYLLYGLTCSSQLAQEPYVEAQNDPGFCWTGSHVIQPACVTHQMMGYRIAQRNGCGIADLDAKIAVLQKTMGMQLRYDPRVVDVYIQRVLMLVDSGAMDRINPRWVERVIAAQQADGGWSDIQPLIPVGGGKYLGFNSKAVTVGVPISNFHTTAQGVLLMSLLRHF